MRATKQKMPPRNRNDTVYHRTPISTNKSNRRATGNLRTICDSHLHEADLSEVCLDQDLIARLDEPCVHSCFWRVRCGERGSSTFRFLPSAHCRCRVLRQSKVAHHQIHCECASDVEEDRSVAETDDVVLPCFALGGRVVVGVFEKGVELR